MAQHTQILYFLYATGCDACDRAKPDIKKFAESHPDVKVVPVDLAKTEWKSTQWEPTTTPTYGLLRPGQRLRIREGAHSATELDLWVKT